MPGGMLIACVPLMATVASGWHDVVSLGSLNLT